MLIIQENCEFVTGFQRLCNLRLLTLIAQSNKGIDWKVATLTLASALGVSTGTSSRLPPPLLLRRSLYIADAINCFTVVLVAEATKMEIPHSSKA